MDLRNVGRSLIVDQICSIWKKTTTHIGKKHYECKEREKASSYGSRLVRPQKIHTSEKL